MPVVTIMIYTNDPSTYGAYNNFLVTVVGEVFK